MNHMMFKDAGATYHFNPSVIPDSGLGQIKHKNQNRETGMPLKMMGKYAGMSLEMPGSKQVDLKLNMKDPWSLVERGNQPQYTFPV